MSLKNVNWIFGCGYLVAGCLKTVLVISVILMMGSAFLAAFTGGSTESYDNYSKFSTIIGFIEIVLAIGTIVMIVLNIKRDPVVLPGYLLGILGLALEFILPAGLFLIFVFTQCGLFIKGGQMIMKKSDFMIDFMPKNRETGNSEWFYNNKEPKTRTNTGSNIGENINKIIGEDNAEFVKENPTTMIIVSIVAAVFLIMCILGYALINGNKKDTDANDGASKTSVLDKNQTAKRSNSQNSGTKSHNSDPVLDEIANTFNGSNAVARMKAQGFTLKSAAENNQIIITLRGEEITFRQELSLDDNILTAKIPCSQETAEKSELRMILAFTLFDSVGIMKGYQESEVMKALSQEETLGYTLDNDGLEITQLDNSDVILKIDLNSDLPFLYR